MLVTQPQKVHQGREAMISKKYIHKTRSKEDTWYETQMCPSLCHGFAWRIVVTEYWWMLNLNTISDEDLPRKPRKNSQLTGIILGLTRPFPLRYFSIHDAQLPQWRK